MNNHYPAKAVESTFFKNITVRKTLFLCCLGICMLPFASAPVALLLGILLVQFIEHPFLELNHKLIHILLQASVVGLGFGINVGAALKAGKEGVLLTVISIFGTLGLGYLIGKIFKINKKTSALISVGTAVCGGSAIAAIAPVIKSEEKQTAIALGSIFILNAVALFLFPFVGQQLHLTQTQFGMWCAIAIHDTSSVVGAAGKFGNEALQIATTVKLARALWIIPIAFFSGIFFRSKNTRIKLPYFILLFVLAIIFNTYVPLAIKAGPSITHLSKIGLTVTLFLIGSSLSRKVIMAVGLKPILQGLILWVIIASATLMAVIHMF